MESAFESWIGQPVIVRVALGHVRISLRGTVLKEQNESLLMKARYGPDLEIRKSTLLAIEEAGACSRGHTQS